MSIIIENYLINFINKEGDSMRTKKASINMIVAFIANIITILIGFIAQAFFLHILGAEYLGINGLFTNIVSMLGIVELGIGSAIIYHLYKPLASNDRNTIKLLMRFYKKAYYLIALIIFILSMFLIPFLPFFIKEVTIDVNIVGIYLLFVLDIIFSYLLSYKRSILYADQKNYIISLVHIFYLIVLNVLQILILYFTKDYYLYLIIKVFMRLIENILIAIIVNKKYSYLKERVEGTLEKEVVSDIYQKIKSLFFHKIGSFVISGTDNIIISKFLGLVTVGLYSNYYMVISALQTLFSQVLTALTPSVGNLLIEEDHKKSYDVFRKIRFINFWISCVVGVGIFVVMDSLITVWIGKSYLLSIFVLFVLVINFYQAMMRSSYTVFKEAAGIFYEDRYVPLIEALINIIFSIILVKVLHLAGVFIATFISSLALWGYSYPKYVYKKLFQRDYKSYIKESFAYLCLFLMIMVLTYEISILWVPAGTIIALVYKTLLVLLIPNIILFILFHKTDNFIYILNYIKKREN